MEKTSRRYEFVVEASAVIAADWFPGLLIHQDGGVAVLETERIDQATLFDALRRVASLGLVLMSLRPLDGH